MTVKTHWSAMTREDDWCNCDCQSWWGGKLLKIYIVTFIHTSKTILFFLFFDVISSLKIVEKETTAMFY